ncbi:hypothetical protein [Streptomyces sp. ODS28]|uniref:hypothetical protein n=1 Tax=Streptomyces sp. ODS28 TaxID=3136688 RepID=UPI0031E5E2E1
MARYAPNQRLAALLLEAGWTAAELAREVNAVGHAQGRHLSYTRSSIAHWLRGSRPRAPVPELAALAFSRRLNRPVTAEDTGLSKLPPAQAALPPDSTGEPAPLDHLLLLTRGDTDPATRVLLRHLPFTPPRDATARWPVQAAPLPAPVRHGRAAAPSDTHALQAVIRTVVDLAAGHGGAYARTAVAAYLADDACPLLIQRASRPLRRELFLRTAQLAHMLGVMTDDAGHHELAQRYFTAVLGLARQAGDRSTFAIALRAMSLQALRLGHPRDAHALATLAADTAGETAVDAVRAFVLIQRSRTAAGRRQPRLALALMDEAVGHHEQASGTSDPFATYPRAGLDYQRAAVLSALGRHADAVAALEDSTKHRGPQEHAPSALTHARLAETHLRLGHLDAACTHWHHFLELYPRLHSRRADQALMGLRQALRPYSLNAHARSVLQQARPLAPRAG